MIAVLLITHEQLGEANASLLRHFFNDIPPHIALVGVSPNEDLAAVRARIETARAALPPHRGVLALADIFGATPFNAAAAFADGDFALLSGLNAPMLIKAAQYAPNADDLAAFTETVREAAVQGIIAAPTQAA